MPFVARVYLWSLAEEAGVNGTPVALRSLLACFSFAQSTTSSPLLPALCMRARAMPPTSAPPPAISCLAVHPSHQCVLVGFNTGVVAALRVKVKVEMDDTVDPQEPRTVYSMELIWSGKLHQGGIFGVTLVLH